MNSNLEINSVELENATLKIEETSKKIAELFNEIDNSMKELYNSETWSGDANDTYYKRYQKLSEYFPKINNGLATYVSFLRTTNDNYVRAEKSLGNQIDTNEAELNVN